MNLIQVPSLSEQAWREVEQAIDQTILRDPHQVNHRRTKMRLLRWRAETWQHPEDYQAAITAAKEVLALYPQSPPDLAALADRELEAAIAFRKIATTTDESSSVSTALLDSAIHHFQAALDMDNQRLKWEKLHRMSKQEINRLQDHLDVAKKLRVKEQ